MAAQDRWPFHSRDFITDSSVSSHTHTHTHTHTHLTVHIVFRIHYHQEYRCVIREEIAQCCNSMPKISLNFKSNSQLSLVVHMLHVFTSGAIGLLFVVVCEWFCSRTIRKRYDNYDTQFIILYMTQY